MKLSKQPLSTDASATLKTMLFREAVVVLPLSARWYNARYISTYRAPVWVGNLDETIALRTLDLDGALLFRRSQTGTTLWTLKNSHSFLPSSKYVNLSRRLNSFGAHQRTAVKPNSAGVAYTDISFNDGG